MDKYVGNTEDRFEKICEELEELIQKNQELEKEFDKKNSDQLNTLLSIFFSIAFVASLCLIIFAIDSKDAIMIITGLVTASGALYGIFYDEI